MARIRASLSSGGSGGAGVQVYTATLAGGSTLLAENVGSAEAFFFVTQGSNLGSVLTNVNPTTGEILTNQSYRYSTYSGTWALDSTWYVYKDSNNDVRLNVQWSTSAYKYTLICA